MLLLRNTHEGRRDVGGNIPLRDRSSTFCFWQEFVLCQFVLVSKKLSLCFLSFRRVVLGYADGSRPKETSSGRVIQRRREIWAISGVVLWWLPWQLRG